MHPILELNIPDGIRHTATGLIYPPGLSLEQLTDHRRFCARAHASSIYWLTDNSREILKRFGDAALQEVASLVELEQEQARGEQALLKLEVAPLDCLSPEHYVTLGQGDLDLGKQQEWVETAVREKLSPGELKKSIKAGAVVRNPPPGDNTTRHAGVPTPHAVRQQFDFWWREVETACETWEVEALAMAVGELDRIAAAHTKLSALLQAKLEKRGAR